MDSERKPTLDPRNVEELKGEADTLLDRCLYEDGGESGLRELEKLLQGAPQEELLYYRAFVTDARGDPDKAVDYLFRWAQRMCRESGAPFDCNELMECVDPFLDNGSKRLWRSLSEAFENGWPNSAVAYCVRGLAEKEQLNDKAAVRWLSDCLKKDEHFWFAAATLGDFHLDRQEWDDASKYYERAVGDVPAEWPKYAAAANSCLGDCHSILGDSDAATRCYLKTLELNSGDWEAAWAVGDTYREGKNWKQAVGYYNHALQYVPDEERARLTLAMGISLFGAKDYEAAHQAFAKCLAIGPELFGARTYLGMCLARMGKPEEAVAVLREATERTDKDERAEALCRLAKVLRKLKRYPESIAVCKQHVTGAGGLSRWAQAEIREIEALAEKQRQGAEAAKEESADELPDVLPEASPPESVSACAGRAKARQPKVRPASITRESILEELLHDNILNGHEVCGRRLRMYESPDNRAGGYGRQFTMPNGDRIDLLAEDLDSDEFVVIELKRNQGDRQVVGQVLGYMGWVREHLAKTGQGVQGIICVSEITDNLRRMVSEVPNVEVRPFNIQT